MARKLIFVLTLLWAQLVLAAFSEVDKRDSRLPTRAVQFVDVSWTKAPRGIYQTIQPPVGEWSQPIRCPENDKAGAISHSGTLFIMLPGGSILEANDFPDGEKNISSWAMLFGERDFRASAITPGSTFSIQCPVASMLSTHYTYIDSFLKDGYLEVPSCSNDGQVKNCRVLHPNIIDDMNTRKWGLSNLIDDQYRKVKSNNQQIDERFAEIRNKEIRGMLPTIFICGLVIAALVLAVGAIKRSVDRDFKR